MLTWPTENPWVAAQRFLTKNELPATYADQVVEFIEKNTAGVQIGTGEQASTFVDPYTGASRYTGSSGSAGPSTSGGDPFTGMLPLHIESQADNWQARRRTRLHRLVRLRQEGYYRSKLSWDSSR